MKCTHLYVTVAVLTLLPLAAKADFVADSKASLKLRNFYLNRDFRQHDAPQSKAAEWAQGGTLNVESGYTEGTLGFGLNAMVEQGLKLDSSFDRRGTGLLPYGPNSRQVDDHYSELGLTAKARVSRTVAQLGTLQPLLPVVTYNDSRLLASTLAGAQLSSEDIEGSALNLGRLTRVNLRDSSNNQDLGYAGARSDAFDFIGGTYRPTESLGLSYYSARLEDIYRQQYVGLQHSSALGGALSLRTDLRYFDSRDEGSQRAGKIDNRNFNGLLTLGYQAHRFALGWQHLSGNSPFPFLLGADPYVVNLVTFNTFTRAEEHSWQARYDYDFAAQGLPGLTFMSRYVRGEHVATAQGGDGREWERDSDLAYVVQAGPLQGVGLRWRNVTVRSGQGLSTAIDENRLILEYSLALW